MTVSNSTDFALTAADLIEEAMRKVGIHADEEPIEAQALVTGMRALTMRLKSWQIDGVMTWTLTDGTLTLVGGAVGVSRYSYTFGSGGDFTTVPLDITDDMRVTRGTNEIPMIRLSREDYMRLPNKTNIGYPTQWYYARGRAGGTLYVWPSPDTAGGTLNFTYRRQIMDVDAGPNDIDVPAEWYEAIMYNLADKFQENSGFAVTNEGRKISAEAARLYGVVKGYDTGEGMGSISIVPYGFETW
jgi:hypothetical protein